MALADAVQGARYIAQQITWTDEDGTAVDLTGATLTGRKRHTRTGETAALDGTLTLVNAEAGVFSWAYGETDVAEAGRFSVQFIATFGTLAEKTVAARWVVHEAI